jgi:hypothetical protein
VLAKIRQEVERRKTIRGKIIHLRHREDILIRAISRLLGLRPEGFVSKLKLLTIDRNKVQEEIRALEADLKERSWLSVLFNRRTQ